MRKHGFRLPLQTNLATPCSFQQSIALPCSASGFSCAAARAKCIGSYRADNGNRIGYVALAGTPTHRSGEVDGNAFVSAVADAHRAGVHAQCKRRAFAQFILGNRGVIHPRASA